MLLLYIYIYIHIDLYIYTHILYILLLYIYEYLNDTCVYSKPAIHRISSIFSFAGLDHEAELAPCCGLPGCQRWGLEAGWPNGAWAVARFEYQIWEPWVAVHVVGLNVGPVQCWYGQKVGFPLYLLMINELACSFWNVFRPPTDVNSWVWFIKRFDVLFPIRKPTGVEEFGGSNSWIPHKFPKSSSPDAGMCSCSPAKGQDTKQWDCRPLDLNRKP